MVDLVGIMSVNSITQNIDSNNNANKLKKRQIIRPYSPVANSQMPKDSVAFTGKNPVVGLMDFIAAGGFATSFIIQDGLGFVFPRVGGGLLRGGPEKHDEKGNVVLDKNGKPKHELNWALARKELLREMITGPSAFIIPLFMMKYIKKHYGAANDVKLGYLDSFQKPYEKFVTDNAKLVQAGNAATQKAEFYKGVFADVIENSVNGVLPEAEKMSAEEIAKTAEDFAKRQVKIEEIMANKDLKKATKAQKIQELGGSVENAYMTLKKNKIGGIVDETSVFMTSTIKGGKNNGTIGELLGALNNYFDDASKTTQKFIKDSINTENIEASIKQFTKNKMGTRLLTNLGLFGTVALFYTQIPKLYNMGLKENPALAGKKNDKDPKADPSKVNADKKANVAFTGLSSKLGSISQWAFKNKISGYFTDMFELNGPVISGGAMATLLYGFCIPPRLKKAQDKYDFGEILLRDMVAFTTLLFGAKAVARLSTDLFSKVTGLALNRKHLDGKNIFKKFIAYVKPSNDGHKVLSSKELTSKYTNIDKYKDQVNGFIEFIEKSGGNVKKAFTKDKDIKAAVENIVKKHTNKTYAEASVSEIKDALRAANAENGKDIKDFYKLFKDGNGMLETAKTCNSIFDFLSTIVLVPSLIIWLTRACEKMTAKRIKQEQGESQPQIASVAPQRVMTNPPSMAGFLGSAKAS